MKVRSRVGVAMAAGAMVLGVTTLPAGAGDRVPIFEPTVEVTGTARCNLATGHETYQLNWRVENTTEFEVLGGSSAQGLGFGAVEIVAADETGAWTGSIPGMVGQVLEPGDAATGSDGPVPNRAGVVTLTVEYDYELSTGTATGTIVLDGSCTNGTPTTPTTPTTAAPAAAAADAVRVRPAFTG
jgi:hypothetical protein